MNIENMDKMETKILDFIDTLRNADYFVKHIFLNGGCYQFYKIVKSVFPEARPYIKGYPECAHVVAVIGNNCYDINGRYDGTPEEHGFVLMSEELQKEAEGWSFAANNDLYYGECEVCGEPVRIDRQKLEALSRKHYK